MIRLPSFRQRSGRGSASPRLAGRLFQPDNSRAVLIGVSRYDQLSNLSAVRNNLNELSAVLTDPRLGRLTTSNCVVVRDPADGNAVGKALARAAADATDMLLVYYAGHGFGGLRRRQLYLSLRSTDPDRPAFHSLPYDLVREEVLDSRARSRVVILDCCFSGRAASPMMGTDTAELLQQLDIAGAYVLTASPDNEPALSGDRFTEFSGELIQTLRRGIPNTSALLTLDSLYEHLRLRMTARNLPEPRRLHTDAAGQLALAPNQAYKPEAPPSTAVTDGGAASPASPSKPRIAWHRRWLRPRRIALTILVAMLATGGMGLAGLLATAAGGHNALRRQTLATLSADAGTVTQGLQDERASAVRLLANPFSSQAVADRLLRAYQDRAHFTDLAVGIYRSHRTKVNAPTDLANRLDSISFSLSSLNGLRDEVAQYNEVTMGTTTHVYDGLIDGLIDLRDNVARLVPQPSISASMKSVAAFARDKEALSQEHIIGMLSLLSRVLEVSEQQQFLDTLSRQSQALRGFMSQITRDQESLVRQTLAATIVHKSKQLEGRFLQWRPGEPPPADAGSAETWDKAFAAWVDLARHVERHFDDQIVNDAKLGTTTARASILRYQMLLITAVGMAALAATFLAYPRLATRRSIKGRHHQPPISFRNTPEQGGLV
jgi:hypothetical protein